MENKNDKDSIAFINPASILPAGLQIDIMGRYSGRLRGLVPEDRVWTVSEAVNGTSAAGVVAVSTFFDLGSSADDIRDNVSLIVGSGRRVYCVKEGVMISRIPVMFAERSHSWLCIGLFDVDELLECVSGFEDVSALEELAPFERELFAARDRLAERYECFIGGKVM